MFSNMIQVSRFQRSGLFVFWLILCGFFSIMSPHFLTYENLTNILIQSAVHIIVAVGMTLVIATEGVDLSVGSIIAITGIIAAWLMKSGLGVQATVLITIGSGAFLGMLNGLGVVKLGISPFIVTLGTAGIYRALALIFTDARPIYGLPLSFRTIGTGSWGPIPICVVMALLFVFIGYIIVKWTRFGTQAQALGDNRTAAFRMGVPITGTVVGVYAFCGVASALASLVVIARLNTAEAIAGMGIELEAIAAVVMGGTSFSGGEAYIMGTLLGALIIGTLANGLTLINVPSYYQQLVIGVVFMFAVLADRIRRR